MGFFRASSLAPTTGFTARREPTAHRCTNTLRKQLRRGVNRSLRLAAAGFQLPPGTRLCSWRARRRAAPGPSPLTHGTGTLQEDGGQGHAALSIAALPCGDGVPRTQGSPPRGGSGLGHRCGRGAPTAAAAVVARFAGRSSLRSQGFSWRGFGKCAPKQTGDR